MKNYRKLLYKKIDKAFRDKVYRKPLLLENNSTGNHYVSFTFDDIPLSAAENGGKILDNYGIKATFYLSMSRMIGKNILDGGLNKSVVSYLSNNGHEIGCHTYDHIDCSTKHRNLAEQINKNYKAMMSFSPNIQVTSFSYPFGRYNIYSKKIINQKFNTGRTIKKGINYGYIDLNLLKSNSIYSKFDSIHNYKEIVDENKKKNGWLIFYTHDVQKNPTQFGCTPKFFENLVEYAVKSGAIIEPVHKVYKLIQ